MLLRSIAVAALTTLAVAQSPQIHPQTVDDLLPASTYGAMRFGGLEACRQATGQLPLTQLVKTFLGELPSAMREEVMEEKIEEAAEHIRRALKRHGLKPADLRALVGQPMAMGLGRLSIEGMGASVCLVIEEGNQREAINRCMRVGLSVLRRFVDNVSVDKIKIGGHDFYHVSSDGPPIFAGSIAGNYCVSNSRGYLREIAAVAAGTKPGLTAATSIAGLRQQLPAPPLFAWALNARSVMDAMAPHLPYEAQDLADAIGLGRLDLLYGAMTASQRGGTDLLHFGIGGSERGLAKTLVSAPVDLSFASACSSNTIVFGAGSFDVPAVIDAFQRFIKLLPKQAQREMKREMGGEMAREFRRMGTSPAEVNTLLRAFGNQIGFAIGLEKGVVPKPELLVRLSVRDAAPILGLLQRLEAASSDAEGVEWRSRKAGDQEIRFCNMKIEGKFQLSPCYALADDALWIGSDVAGLVRSMRRASKPAKSLAGTEDFQRMAKESAGASGVLHIRSFRGIEIGWRSVETMLYPMLDAKSDELGFDSDALPDSEELAAALGTTTLIYRVDDEGVTVKSEGPVTLGALLAAFGALGDEVLGRATGRVF